MATDERLCVAVLANSSWNVFNFRKTLIQFLIDQNHRVLVIAPEDAYTSKLLIWEHIEFIPVRNLSATSLNPLKDFLLMLEYCRIFKNFKTNLILAHTIKPNIYASLVGRWLRIPVVSSLTGLGSVFIHDTLINKVLRKFYQWAVTRNSFILFHNHSDRNDWIERCSFPISKTGIIPGSGVDINRYKQNAKQEQSHTAIFLFLGRLHPDKGIKEFLHAAKALMHDFPDFNFWIAGEIQQSDFKGDYEEIMDLLNSIHRLSYFGKQSAIHDLLEKVTAVVLPSYREGMSRALMEAMSMSKPVIATSVAGNSELIVNGVEGILVPARDAHALAKAMIKLSKMPFDQLQEMGAAGRLRIESYYSTQKVYLAYQEIFLKLLK